MSSPPSIIHTAHLFPELDAALVHLLQSLSDEEWRAPTIAPGWNVHHVAGHLLDTALRRLSLVRDSWRLWPAKPVSPQELVGVINELNALGVRVYGALSPALLITLTEIVTPQLATYLASLDPMGPAAFPVSWAGEDASHNWFDIARELTERWHHQQQILLATNRPGIMTPALYGPVLDTFMRVLPYTYREVEAPDGTSCDVVVPGDCGGRWRVVRRERRWTMIEPHGDSSAATAVIPDDLAWRLFTKGATRAEARARVVIHGESRLGAVVLDALAIVG
jgi:uncharacterized protein (TIGR03083 family)